MHSSQLELYSYLVFTTLKVKFSVVKLPPEFDENLFFPLIYEFLINFKNLSLDFL